MPIIPTDCDSGAVYPAMSAYAARGWPVLPLHHVLRHGARGARCSCLRARCDSPGKHPRTEHGVKDATTDPAVITRWLEQWPDAGVGLATGTTFDVLDLDDDGALSYVTAEVCDPWALAGPVVHTGRGWHFYLQPVPGARNRARLGAGVDYRAGGGYVVAPPSVHYSGVPYAWADHHGPDNSLPVCPAPVHALLEPSGAGRGTDTDRPPRQVSRGYGGRALDGEVERLFSTPNGHRNDRLNVSAYTLGRLVVAGHLAEAEVRDALEMAGRAIGLGAVEVKVTVASGLRAGIDAGPRAARPPDATGAAT
jgi:hypothetical protein